MVKTMGLGHSNMMELPCYLYYEPPMYCTFAQRTPISNNRYKNDTWTERMSLIIIKALDLRKNNFNVSFIITVIYERLTGKSQK